MAVGNIDGGDLGVVAGGFFNQLDQIPDHQSPLITRGLHRLTVHVYVLGAGDDESLESSDREGLLDPLLARPLAGTRTGHPNTATPGATTKAVCSVTLHLDQCHPERRKDSSGSLGDLRVTREMTGVVICHRRTQSLLYRESPFDDQVIDDFSIVSNRIVRPDCRIFMFESVVRVGVSGDNFFEPGISETRCVVFGQELVKPLLADATNVVAGVALATIEDAEVKTRSVEHPSHALGNFALARIVRGVVPAKPQDVDSLLPGILDGEAKALRPLSPVALGFAERIPVT